MPAGGFRSFFAAPLFVCSWQILLQKSLVI
jgi:hypothetical protein